MEKDEDKKRKECEEVKKGGRRNRKRRWMRRMG